MLGKAAMAMKKKANFFDGIKSGEGGGRRVGANQSASNTAQEFQKLKHDVSSHKKIEECEAIEHRAREGRVGGSMEKRHKNN